METQILDILRKNQLSVTDTRRKILGLFLESESALEHMDIEKKTGEKFDRVTVYRTLHTFMEKGIIHTIPTSNDSIKYALCRENCTQGHHHDNHIHFICTQCGSTICLDETIVPIVHLPNGYKALEVNMTVNGVCKECHE